MRKESEYLANLGLATTKQDAERAMWAKALAPNPHRRHYTPAKRKGLISRLLSWLI